MVCRRKKELVLSVAGPRVSSRLALRKLPNWLPRASEIQLQFPQVQSIIAKVGVEGSNPFARSIIYLRKQQLRRHGGRLGSASFPAGVRLG